MVAVRVIVTCVVMASSTRLVGVCVRITLDVVAYHYECSNTERYYCKHHHAAIADAGWLHSRLGRVLHSTGVANARYNSGLRIDTV